MTSSALLAGRSGIVTGGTRGIGAAVVRLFAEHGARLIIVARTPETGHALINEVGVDRAVFVRGDVVEPETAVQAVNTALEAFGSVDVLVNNAGMDYARLVLDTPLVDVHRVLATNFVAAFGFLQAAAQAMRPHGGSIINVVSRTANVGVPTMGAYGASKGALLSLTRVAALELAPYNIRVNAVAPGMTNTPLIRSWIQDQENPSDFEREIIETVPLGRLATPEEVAAAILFLASPEASYVTGACIPVDGGYTTA